MRYEIRDTGIGTTGGRLSGAFLALESWLTLERVGYAVGLILALGLRLIGLNWRPLTGDEAAQALQALNAARALPFDMAASGPLLFNLQRVTFLVFGADEFTARFWPALLGGLSVLSFYAFRSRLGKGGALMAAFLWAISPLAVLTSRLGLGVALVASFALATAAALEISWQQARRGQSGATTARAWAVVAGAGFALLLASGPAAYTLIAAALFVALIWRNAARNLWRALRPHGGLAALAFGLTLVLSTTFAFSAPQGLAAALALPGDWARKLLPWAGEYGAPELLGRLVMSEILIVGLSLAGLVRALRLRDDFAIAAVGISGVVLLSVIVGRGRHPADLTLAILPLVFLAGPVAARIIGRFADVSGDLDSWILMIANLVLLLAAAFALPGAFNPAATQTWRQVFLVVGIVTLALAVLQWFLYGTAWGNWRTVGRVLPFVLLLLGVFWTFSQTIGINYDRGAWRQPGVVHESTGAGYADLERGLRDLAAFHGSGMNESPVDLVLVPGRDEPFAPVLLWLLRDFPSVRQSAAIPPSPAPIVIAAVEEQPLLADRYSGREFALLERWQSSSLPDAYARLRWALYRQTSVPPETRGVLLWVRAPQVNPALPGAPLPLVIPEAPASGVSP